MCTCLPINASGDRCTRPASDKLLHQCIAYLIGIVRRGHELLDIPQRLLPEPRITAVIKPPEETGPPPYLIENLLFRIHGKKTVDHRHHLFPIIGQHAVDLFEQVKEMIAFHSAGDACQ